MAKSPAHRFGQIIGDVLEAAVEPVLREFAEQHGLYLDRKGRRPARTGTKVTWQDEFGNKHDLDFVLESGGTDTAVGRPVAFIETAWRRYTKHSRNKAQEIQAAVGPLVARYRRLAPLYGVVLAGEWTDGAMTQLRSHGFAVVHFPYAQVVSAFATAGVDAQFDENTPDADIAPKVARWASISKSQRVEVATALVESGANQLAGFLAMLTEAATRQIVSVRILALHGVPLEWGTVGEALGWIESYDESKPTGGLNRYEAAIRYSNGSELTATGSRTHVIAFLQTHLPPPLQPAT